METKLKPPKPVTPVDKKSVSNMIELGQEDIKILDDKLTHVVEDLLSHEAKRDRLKEKAREVQQIGDEDIRKAASVSSKLLDRPASTLSSGIFDDASSISRALIDLRTKVEELDPSNHSNLLSKKKLFGFIPMGSNIRNYFRKYQSAQTHINAIICSLKTGKDDLLKDNAAIEEEKVNLWGLMENLEKHLYYSQKMDTLVTGRITSIEGDEPERAKILKEELLFYLRQKIQDMITQLAISVQGYMAMDMIIKNNNELIKGVDRATHTTVSALRTAVTVAQALANEKLVLDQIKALNDTTGNLVERTSMALKNNAAQIHQNAVDNTIEIEKIKNAFANIYDTIDMIDTYKAEAVTHMSRTIEELSRELAGARSYLSKQDLHPG